VHAAAAADQHRNGSGSPEDRNSGRIKAKDVAPTHAATAFRATLEGFLIDAATERSLPAGVESLVDTVPDAARRRGRG
jgi:hypothetical protein